MTDAGLSTDKILILDSLQEEGGVRHNGKCNDFKFESDLNYFEGGPILKDLLRVQSVKAYLDGALGSKRCTIKSTLS